MPQDRDAALFYDLECVKWDQQFTFSPAPRIRRKRILAWLRELGEIPSLLDVGCGNAMLLKEISKLAPQCRLYGADVSQPVIDDNRKRYPNINFEFLDLNRQVLPHRFDTVICSEVVEHCQDYLQTIEGLVSMTGKHLIITVPTGPLFPIDRHVGHVRHLTRQEMETALQASGMQVIRAEAWGFPFFNLYKYLINLSPEKTTERFCSTRPYGWMEKLISHLVYLVFHLNVPWLGHQLFILARRKNENIADKPSIITETQALIDVS
ncbi:MAG: methyltransferase [Magnetococcales bacterium]|nr:methyltransferase [Magnetococcales bacterium]